jgi:hypothetical protein
VGLWWSLRICTSDKFIGGADAGERKEQEETRMEKTMGQGVKYEVVMLHSPTILYPALYRISVLLLSPGQFTLILRAAEICLNRGKAKRVPSSTQVVLSRGSPDSGLDLFTEGQGWGRL